MNLKAESLSLNIFGHQVLDNINFELSDRKMTGLIGPNGSGKSTLLRCLSGLYPAKRGHILLNNTSLKEINQRSLACRLAFVPQHAEAEPEMLVEHIVRLGRSPHRGPFSAWNESDRGAVNEAIRLTQLSPLLGRCWRQLSGGERQRCQIARALAQQPEILLLDEPTNHLDIHYQLELMQLLASLSVTTVIALHDLNLAAHYCDRLIVLRSGKIVGDGSPEAVLDTELIKSTWNVNANVKPVGDKKVRIHYNYEKNKKIKQAS